MSRALGSLVYLSHIRFRLSEGLLFACDVLDFNLCVWEFNLIFILVFLVIFLFILLIFSFRIIIFILLLISCTN